MDCGRDRENVLLLLGLEYVDILLLAAKDALRSKLAFCSVDEVTSGGREGAVGECGFSEVGEGGSEVVRRERTVAIVTAKLLVTSTPSLRPRPRTRRRKALPDWDQVVAKQRWVEEG